MYANLIQQAYTNTVRVHQGHAERMFRQRAGKPCADNPHEPRAPCYPGYTHQQLKETLLDPARKWAVLEPESLWTHAMDSTAKTVFVTELEGNAGWCPLSVLPSDEMVKLIASPHGLVPGVIRTYTHTHTYAVLGGAIKPLLLDFHPGASVWNKPTLSAQLSLGEDVIPADVALAMGFTHARSITEQEWAARAILRPAR